jgi:imidazolonepropionase-like amidohydrolase
MQALGMSAMDAIKSATSVAAEMLDMSGQIGVIAPGAYADIIAVSGDPLRDIHELERVQFVMKNGKVYKQSLEPTSR